MTVYTLSDTAKQGEYVNFSIKVEEPIKNVNVMVSCDRAWLLFYSVYKL